MSRAASPKRGRSRRRPVRKRNSAAALLWRHASNAGVFVLTALTALALAVVFYARDLPDANRLWSQPSTPRISLIAADGSPLSVQGESMGAPVRLSELPRYVGDAVLAVEDRTFYHHIGVNPVSVARAFLVNAAEGDIRQGGSTITQQLAKNLFLSSDRTVKRKVQELLLAFWLERKFRKEEILTLYLNRVYFGAGAYGVDAAAYRYFAKPARLLTLGEAAVLAGLLKAPSRYAPTHNPGDAGARARLVIDAMLEAGFLSEDEARRALAEPVRLAAPRFAAAPYFIDYVLQDAARLSQGIDADLIVQTTFDPEIQAALETGAIAGLALSALDDDVQIAAAIVDREGAVRALLGGRDYRRSQFNRAVNARRQPGSAFKPFVFLAALEIGMTPQDVVLDAPIQIGRWKPDNYRGKYYGEVSMTEALARSLNSATVRLQEWSGRAAVRSAAKRMGLDAVTHGPALALGVDAVTPLELVGAYAAFANGGQRAPVHAIESIRTIDGQLVYRRPPTASEYAADPRVIAQMNAMLRAIPEWGTGRAAAVPGYAVAGKTGTTQDSRDAWFAGHAGGLAGVVWVGRDNFAPMKNVTGGTAPAIIWREIFSRALPLRTFEAAEPEAPYFGDDWPPEDPDDPLGSLLRETI